MPDSPDVVDVCIYLFSHFHIWRFSKQNILLRIHEERIFRTLVDQYRSDQKNR